MTINCGTAALDTPNTARWAERALCVGDASPDDWFADIGTDGYDRAKRICAMCPVRAACTQYGESIDAKFGRFGDLVYGTNRSVDKIKHGSHAGWAAHKRAGQTPCAECMRAERDYKRESMLRSRERRRALRDDAARDKLLVSA